MMLRERDRAVYIRILRGMTPDQRLRKAIELTELGRTLFAHGLRKAFPNLAEGEFQQLLRKRISKCHNKNY